jgi:hypothetical protein
VATSGLMDIAKSGEGVVLVVRNQLKKLIITFKNETGVYHPIAENALPNW